MDDFLSKSYFATVTSSDEAFIWVIMNAYYERWKTNEKGRAGPVMGYTDTACKKMKEFCEYEHTALKSREPNNAVLWSDKLMETARELSREREVEVADTVEVVVEESEEEKDETSKQQREFDKHTLDAIEGGSDDDDDDDNNNNDGSDNDNESDE